MLKDGVQWVLHASERLGGIVILVVNMDVAVLDSLLHFGAQQIVIDERLGRFARKLHHHAGRSVGIHVGILTSDVVVLHTDDGVEDLLGLGLTCHVSGIAVGDIHTSDLFTVGLHEFHLDGILDILHFHECIALFGDVVGDGGCQDGIYAFFGCFHGLANGIFDFVEVKINGTTIALNDFLYHFLYYIKICLMTIILSA